MSTKTVLGVAALIWLVHRNAYNAGYFDGVVASIRVQSEATRWAVRRSLGRE